MTLCTCTIYYTYVCRVSVIAATASDRAYIFRGKWFVGWLNLNIVGVGSYVSRSAHLIMHASLYVYVRQQDT